MLFTESMMLKLCTSLRSTLCISDESCWKERICLPKVFTEIFNADCNFREPDCCLELELEPAQDAGDEREVPAAAAVCPFLPFSADNAASKDIFCKRTCSTWNVVVGFAFECLWGLDEVPSDCWSLDL